MLKIGMRNIKTGIGVAISIIAGKLGLVQNPFFTAIACLASIKNTVKGSVETGWHRIVGTLIGGISGFIFGNFFNDNPIIVAAGVCAIIYICNLLKINNSINMSLVTFLSIILSLDDKTNILEYSIIRTWDTSVGVIIGLGVNYFIHRSKYLIHITNDMITVKKEFFDLVEDIIAENRKIELIEVEEKTLQLEGLYNRFVAEAEYSNKNILFGKYKRSLFICKTIYSHLSAIDLMEGVPTLTTDNYNKIIEIWPNAKINRVVEDNKCPVFNYHVRMILKEMDRELLNQ